MAHESLAMDGYSLVIILRVLSFERIQLSWTDGWWEDVGVVY